MFNINSSKTIFINAMSRAGQHAVIDWIYAQFNPNKIFFNDMDVKWVNNFFENRTQYYFNNKKYYHSLNPNWEKYGVLEEKLREFEPETTYTWERLSKCDKKLILINFENLDFIDNLEDFDRTSKQFSGEIVNVLVVRDIYNYVASKIKMGRHFYPDKDIPKWKVHAKEYLGKTNSLKNKVIVNFNKWTFDAEYKKELSKKLQTDVFLSTWKHVSSFGGGSSFDHMAMQDSGQKMKVLDRWKEFGSNDLFLSIMKDDELITLSNDIFGFIPGTEKFVK